MTRMNGRTTVGIAFAGIGLAITGFGVYAGLNAVATNTSPTQVSSGTLKLTMADNGAGFTSTVSGMAPGDTVNRYVDLTNGGTLDAKNLTLAASDANSTLLSTDATKGLHVTVTQCTSGVWTASTGACAGGSTSVLLASTALSALSSAQSLVSGAVAQGTVLHLQVKVVLPDETETTTNGNLPAGTVQNLTAQITWTFSEDQRTATTTNS
jgi:spore coat-associated protein N